MNGIMTGTRFDGMKVGNKPMIIRQAHIHWEFLILVQ